MTTKRRIMVVAGVFLAAAAITMASARAGKANVLRAGASMHAVRSSAVQLATKDTDTEVKGEQETDEDGNLTAKITPDQAKAAALAVHPGTATEVELESEDGKAVYGVHINAQDGNKYDVKVDADSGQVLKSEADDEDNEAGEGSHADQDAETDAD